MMRKTNSVSNSSCLNINSSTHNFSGNASYLNIDKNISENCDSNKLTQNLQIKNKLSRISLDLTDETKKDPVDTIKSNLIFLKKDKLRLRHAAPIEIKEKEINNINIINPSAIISPNNNIQIKKGDFKTAKKDISINIEDINNNENVDTYFEYTEAIKKFVDNIVTKVSIFIIKNDKQRQNQIKHKNIFKLKLHNKVKLLNIHKNLKIIVRDDCEHKYTDKNIDISEHNKIYEYELNNNTNESLDKSQNTAIRDNSSTEENINDYSFRAKIASPKEINKQKIEPEKLRLKLDLYMNTIESLILKHKKVNTKSKLEKIKRKKDLINLIAKFIIEPDRNSSDENQTTTIKKYLYF